MPAQPVVSIVVPTCNRLARLQGCIAKIRENVDLPCEIVVVDGDSSDGTRSWLEEEASRNDRLVTILEPQREGAVKAFNKGFRATTGRYVCWSNDDGYPLPGSVESAIEMLERPDLDDVGMVAFYHNWHSPHNVLDRIMVGGETFEMCFVRGYPYANFGLLRRDLLHDIQFADERFYFFGFDPDLSLKIQIEKKLRVVGCRAALMRHEELHDERKLDDLGAGAEDNARLFEKWNLPGKQEFADPRPGYRKWLAQHDAEYLDRCTPVPATPQKLVPAMGD